MFKMIYFTLPFNIHDMKDVTPFSFQLVKSQFSLYNGFFRFVSLTRVRRVDVVTFDFRHLLVF